MDSYKSGFGMQFYEQLLWIGFGVGSGYVNVII